MEDVISQMWYWLWGLQCSLVVVLALVAVLLWGFSLAIQRLSKQKILIDQMRRESSQLKNLALPILQARHKKELEEAVKAERVAIGKYLASSLVEYRYANLDAVARALPNKFITALCNGEDWQSLKEGEGKDG